MRKHMRRVTLKTEYGMTWGWYSHFRELYRRFKGGDDSVLDDLAQYLDLGEENAADEKAEEKAE